MDENPAVRGFPIEFVYVERISLEYEEKENATMMSMDMSTSPALFTASTAGYHSLPKIHLLSLQHRRSVPNAGIDDARPLNRIREVLGINALQEAREDSYPTVSIQIPS